MNPNVGFFRADSTNLPKIDNIMILELMGSSSSHNIAEIRGAKALMASRSSYLDTAVGYVEVKRSVDECIVRAKVVPEHRIANKNYLTTTTVDEKQNIIVSATCDGCAASAGGCKHSLVFLYWLSKKSEEPASTSVQCYWKKPSLSSARLQALQAKDVFKKSKKITLEQKNPSKLKKFLEECRKHEVKNSLAICFDQPKKSFNIYDMTLEYLQRSNDNNFERYKVDLDSQITAEVVKDICKKTMEQANSKLWHNMRQGRLTASTIYVASRCTTADGALVQQILGGYKVPETISIKRGKKLEDAVIKETEKHLNKKIEKTGFILIDSIVGASPDGVGDTFIVEVKCPMFERTIKNYVGEDQVIKPKIRGQMQMQMHATDTNTKNQEISGTPDKPKLSQKKYFKPEASVYGRKHFERNSLAVNFFDSPRNVRLLSKCRPLSVLVVDCVKHPPRKSRVPASKTRKPPYRSYLALQKSSRNIDEASNKVFSCTLKQNNVLKIVNKNICNLIAADTLCTVDRQITNRDDTKKNISEIKCKVKNKKLKPDTNTSAVSLKTTVVDKMISNIDFKKNKGLVGLKITNRILKPESKEIPNSEKKNFIGYEVLKTKCHEPRPPQIQQISEVIKTGNNMNTIGNSLEKKCKTENENSRKKIQSKDHKQKKSSTNLVQKTVVSSIKYNCKNLIANMAKPSAALSGEKNMQASENKDNFGTFLAKSPDNKKLNEVSLKCKLKLDPQIASKFIDKINDEAHTDQIHSNKHLSKELKVQSYSNGKSIEDMCYPKTQNNDNSRVEYTKDVDEKNNQGDLKVQTVLQINNSVSNLVSSEIITNNSNLNDKLIISKQAQIPEVSENRKSEIKTENEIKKEFDDLPDSSETSQNIFDKIAAQQRSKEGITKLDNIVETLARAKNEVVAAARDPIPDCVDPNLLPPQNRNVIRAIPPNVSSVRPIPPNVNSIRPIPPNVSFVRPVPQNLDSIRLIPPNQLFAFIPPTNNAYELNSLNSSTHTNPQFWPQPNANMRPPNQGLSKTIDQQFFDPSLPHYWQNKNISANTNLPLSQRFAPTNEMNYHLPPPWQHRNDPVNINLPSSNIGAYNNIQNTIAEIPMQCAEIPMQWQQSVQSQNQMAFDMGQNNSNRIGRMQTCSYSNSYLNNTNDNSFNLLSHEGSLLFPPPPPPPSSQTLLKINPNQDKSTNNTPNQLKKASLITAASQGMKLEEGHTILGTSKRKVSDRMVTKPRNESNLVYVSSLESDGNTTAPKLNIKRAATTFIKAETPNKIRLMPPQTSTKQFFRLTPTPGTCSSYNSANLASVNKGYSPPILPIPTVGKSIEIMRILHAMQNKKKTDDNIPKSLNNPDKTHVVVRRKYIPPPSIMKKTTLEKKPPNKRIISTHGIKKISLEEYKKRTPKDNENCVDLTLDEIKQSKVEGEVNKFIHDRVGNVERQSIDSQDLGYDSDITVRL